MVSVKISAMLMGCFLALAATTTMYAWMCRVVKHDGDEVRPTVVQPEGSDNALKCSYPKGHTCIYKKGAHNRADLDKHNSSKDFPCAEKMH